MRVAKVKNKPPTWMLDNGSTKGVLTKGGKRTLRALRWSVMLHNKEILFFPTRGHALRFFEGVREADSEEA